MATLVSRLYDWVTDKGNSVKITASRMDAENDQIITALNRKCLCASSAPESPIAGQTWVDTTNKLVKSYLDNAWKEVALMERVYPIGIVVTLGVTTNPATLFGVGTWTAIEGKVIVGISNEAGDSAFDTLDETGGAQTVTLTAAQSGVPAHTHTITYYSNEGDVGYPGATNGGTTAAYATPANTPANAAEAHTNLQPYIVKYVWQRTA